MRHGFQAPPRTIMEVYKMLPEGTLAELIDGNLYMSPSPNKNHQQVLRNIFIRLHSMITERQLGDAYFAPFDVFLDETTNAVQPDIVFISAENLPIIHDDAVHDVPDLLIEILSAGNSFHDLVRKKDLYQRYGVKEYWIIDPQTKESIGYSMKDQIYNECGRFVGKIASPLLTLELDF